MTVASGNNQLQVEKRLSERLPAPLPFLIMQCSMAFLLTAELQTWDGVFSW